MANDHRQAYDLGLLIMRLAMGGYILLAGIYKLQHGIDNFVHGKYADMTPSWVPHALAVPYGYFVPIGEVVFGALFVLGLFTRKVAIILFLMVLSYTIAQANAGVLMKGYVYQHNIIYLALIFFFCVANPGRHTLDPLWKKKIGKSN